MIRWTPLLLTHLLMSGCEATVQTTGGPLTFGKPDIRDSAQPTDSGTPPAPGPDRIEGLEAGSGFGSAIAIGPDGLFVGAPHGPDGTVFQVDDVDAISIVSGPGRLGAHLAITEAGLWIAAPLTDGGIGAVVDRDGTVVQAGIGGTGIALTSGPPSVVGHASTWVASDGRTGSLPGRPSSAAVAEGTIGLGMAFGAIALHTELGDWERPVPNDEAGFALAAGDFDGDGDPDWAVGAPGAGMVHLIDANTLTVHTTLEGTGRFGASLSSCPSATGDALLVGAPMDGAQLEGAAHLFVDPTLLTATASWSGSTPGAELGFAVACDTDVIVLGAPGGVLDNGAIVRVNRTL